jgi:hypothetical protein
VPRHWVIVCPTFRDSVVALLKITTLSRCLRRTKTIHVGCYFIGFIFFFRITGNNLSFVALSKIFRKSKFSSNKKLLNIQNRHSIWRVSYAKNVDRKKGPLSGHPFSFCFVMTVVSQNVQFLGQYLCLCVFIFINNT